MHHINESLLQHKLHTLWQFGAMKLASRRNNAPSYLGYYTALGFQLQSFLTFCFVQLVSWHHKNIPTDARVSI